jgi:hypothetical protein
MAWIGRVTAWSLLAWSWQRLSFALVPIRWAAIPTALALAYYIEAFNMAGEWLIGGIEGKSLAYPFVFFALEAMLRHRWNRVGIFLGIASALHILVGGWATLIIGVLYFIDGRRQTAGGCRNFPWVGLIIGGLLALCGLIPALMLNSGTSPGVLHEAHQIYVFKRLQHHLVPYLIKESFLLRFALLTVIWILLCRQGGKRQRMFNAFVWGTLGIAAVGLILAYSIKDQKLSAEILRFYWFRLSDIAVPMGVAIGAVRFCLKLLHCHLAGTLFKVGNRPPDDCVNNVPYPSGGGLGWGEKAKEHVALTLALSQRARGQSAEYRTLPPSGRQPTNVLTIIVIITAIYFTATYFCFGWFKMTPDASVPWAMTLLICLGIVYAFRAKAAKSPHSAAVCRLPSAVLFYIALAFYAPLTALPNYANLRIYSGQCRTDPVGPMGKRAIGDWKDMCQWIQENTSKEDKFWIPRDGQTFKWYAQRADIGTWKNLPQDAESIVQWYKSMDELYVYKDADGKRAEDRLLTTLLNSKTEDEIAALQQKYGFTYILCAQSYEMPKHTTLEMVYENDVYCLYCVWQLKKSACSK